MIMRRGFSFIIKLINLGKDCIFPIFCLGCKKEGEWVCQLCLSSVDVSGTREVFSVGNIISHSSVAEYEKNFLMTKIIKTLKYDFSEDVLKILNIIMENYFLSHKDFDEIDIVVPVPLHAKRFAERGFNQAERIGRIVGQLLSVPLVPLIKRNRQTKVQALLGREDRFINVKGAFVLVGNSSLANKNILLVDDVFTTGSTMQDCARVLKQSGANVYGFSLARG